MAFRFDRTPLGAVASLAKQAGQVKAAETAFSQNLAMRQLADSESARAMSASVQMRELAQREEAFQLQRAAAQRDEERVQIAQERSNRDEARLNQSVVTEDNRYKIQQGRLQLAEDRANAIANRDRDIAAEKVRVDTSLIEDREADQLREARLGVAASAAKLKEAGAVFDTATQQWYTHGKLYGKNKVTDPTTVAEYTNLYGTMQSGMKKAAELEQRGQMRQMEADPNSDYNKFKSYYGQLNAAQKSRVDALTQKHGFQFVFDNAYPPRIAELEAQKQAAINTPKPSPIKLGGMYPQ